MKAMLVDDEKSVLLIMKRLLAQLGGVEVAGSFQQAAKALEFARQAEIDIAFIDISMPKGDGLQLARDLQDVRAGIDVVFVTSHKEYALEAFEVAAFDYIVKPISPERLRRTVSRAAERRGGAKGRADATPRKRLAVQVLGGVDVRSERNGAVKWRSAKSVELFSYLLMHRSRNVSKERMVEDIFGGMPLHNAKTYLNTAIYQIREVLAPHGQKAAVIYENFGYRLDLTEMEVDAFAFESRAAGFPAITAANADEACRIERLFAGELFGEKAYMWALAERERLSDLHADFAGRLSRWLLEHGEAGKAAGIVKKLVRLHELDEEINVLLLRVYASLRDRPSLIRHYERFVLVLEEELGVEPSPSVRQLYLGLLHELGAAGA